MGGRGIEFTMRIPRKLVISRRIRKLQLELGIGTQKMRARMLEGLADRFKLLHLSLACEKAGTQTSLFESI
jgi:hypothetical protein